MIEYHLDISTVDQLNKEQLIQTIEYLMLHNFERLVYALNRIDVDEIKIKQLLNANTTVNTATLIATAIIERQLEKKISRNQFKQNSVPNSSEEAW